MAEIDWKNIFTEQEQIAVSNYIRKNKKEIQKGFKKYAKYMLSQQAKFNSPRQFRRESIGCIIKSIANSHKATQ